jgi:hypothetical protein
MSITKWEVRAGAYYDSVVLMQLQRSLAGLDGVVDAGVVMATPANRELLLAGDLWPEETTALADGGRGQALNPASRARPGGPGCTLR